MKTPKKKAPSKKAAAKKQSGIKKTAKCKLICPRCGVVGTYNSVAACNAALKKHPESHGAYCDCEQTLI